MISVAEAFQIIQQHTINLAVETIDFRTLNGRTLAQDLIADSDLPPFNRVTMDGIAVNYEAFVAIRNLPLLIEGIQAAGQPQLKLHQPTACIEVMTGAMLPQGCDTVVRYEDVILTNTTAKVHPETPLSKGQNIQKQGIEKQKGEILVHKNRVAHAGIVAIAASCGYQKVHVYKLPKVAIVSTGNELVAVNQIPLAHQIRRSNVYGFEALLQHDGIQAQLFHFQDDEAELEAGLNALLSQFDCILMSGGVSKGKLDFVPQVLQTLGVDVHFHRIAQKPGKPMWFGSKGNAKVFAFPGNPVSGMVCYLRYFRPWLATVLCRKQRPIWAIVKDGNAPNNGLTNFIPARWIDSNTVQLLAGKGSGDFANLSQADGFVEFAPNSTFSPSQPLPFWSL